MKCPNCGKKLLWKEGLLTDTGWRDMTFGRYYCPCGIIGKPQESRDIRKGRKLVESMKGVSALDKTITALPVAVQIGLLRERQKMEDK